MAKKSICYNGNTFEISYEILHQKAKTDCVILHGWGSNKTLMKQAFGEYLPKMRHIYIDLPGFGNSTNTAVLDTQQYTDIINLFLQELGISKDIVIGHSFGGKIATLLKPELLVLLSSAGIVLEKPFSVKTKIMLYKILKAFGLSRFRRFFVAQDAQALSHEMYETFKKVVDEDMRSDFKVFPNKALLFWGKEDTATPIKAAQIMAELIDDSSLVVYEGDHYFFLHHIAEIAQKIEITYTKTTERK